MNVRIYKTMMYVEVADHKMSSYIRSYMYSCVAISCSYVQCIHSHNYYNYPIYSIHHKQLNRKEATFMHLAKQRSPYKPSGLTLKIKKQGRKNLMFVNMGY